MRLLSALGCAAVGAAAVTSLTTMVNCSDASMVRQVFTALDGSGFHVRDTFYSDVTQIFCDVDFSGRGKDNTVDVLFQQIQGEQNLYDGSNNMVTVDRQWGAAQQFGQAGVGILPFTLNQFTDINTGVPLPYPVGKWKCLVSVNGVSAGESDFTVIYPGCTSLTSCGAASCPPGIAESTGNLCTAYLTNPPATCPSAGDLTNAQACHCEVPDGGGMADRRWVCQ